MCICTPLYVHTDLGKLKYCSITGEVCTQPKYLQVNLLLVNILLPYRSKYTQGGTVINS